MSPEDRAQEQELRQWEQTNKPRSSPTRFAPGDIGYGPEYCDRCDNDMPAARRAHGFTLCVECKTISEKFGH